METLEETLSIYDLNQLIEKSFGRGFKCNYHPHGISVWSEGIEEKNNLGLIAKNGWIFETRAGWFGDENQGGPRDGSVITVAPKYGREALKYAKLYKEKTGKQVSVHVVSKK